ncbi:hypothetical protein SAMN05421664_0519 [Chryseobacterium soldanellicola]|uniref:Uncharacterized protein n=1 Tax=Chryseobacterium soldanellicola TaxID=311333 RepID=A0A1H0Y6U2_9FLAO|nr:hypothetical protein [Chryseobacterium soldanellicola]SDQ10800.1 hypothetical protein SAMN05421664_0519 [Chryseobacterium soldanellicola]
MQKNSFLVLVFTVTSVVMYGQVGINTTTPGTTLDVNGAITNRETAVAVASNAGTVPANVSQVRLTGAATANVVITAPAAPNAGQRLIIYNNTTGGFGASLNGFTIANGQAMEFAYSNGGWRATNGGAAVAGTDWSVLGNTGTLPANNFLGTSDNQDMVIRTNNTEKMRVQAGGNVGIGTAAPITELHVSGNTTQIEATVQNTTAGQASLDLRNTLKFYRTVLDGTGDYQVFDATAGASRITIDGPTGNIGINNNASPTANLDVNGTARVRNTPILAAANGGSIAIPLYEDNLGNVVKNAPPGNGNIMSGISSAIAPGGTQAVINNVPDGTIHELTVVASDGCTITAVADFWAIGNSVGGTALQGKDGFASQNGISPPTFTETQTTSAVVWSGVSTCASGGGPTHLNFKVGIVPAGSTFQIQITNQGDTNMAYSVKLERIGSY